MNSRTQPQLSSTQMEALQEDGFCDLRTVAYYRDRWGFPTMLIEGKDEHSRPYRAWLRDGESIADMKWDEQKADGSWPETLRDGEDMMNWEIQARKRIADDVQLSKHQAHIFYDWCNWEEHMEWVATADREEIVDWCEETSIEELS